MIIAVATAYSVATMVVLAQVHRPAVIIPVLIAAGYCWTSTMASLNTSVQMSVPAWVQARALGTYLMSFQGGLALGSVLWGAIAEAKGAGFSLLCAGCGFAASYPFVRRFHILRGGVPDTSPRQLRRAAPELAPFPEAEEDDPAHAGPVRISIEYLIPVESYAEFTQVMHRLRGVRLRGGALRWGIYRDAMAPERLEESFIMESWLDYLRSRERVTKADDAVRQQAWALHQAEEPPRVSYQIYAKEVAQPTPHS
jgi:hypothetical protein